MHVNADPDEGRLAQARLETLIGHFGQGGQCVAWHLCDRHAPQACAYRIVSRDLSVSELTYGELRGESERLAAGFVELGLGRGDRIATLMGKSRAYLVTLMAIWRIGAVHLPLFTAFAPAAISHRLDQAKARLVVCDDAQIEKLRPGVDMPLAPSWRIMSTGHGWEGVLSYETAATSTGPTPWAVHLRPGDPFIHIFTSGTTGKPKGLVMPVRSLTAIQIYMEFAVDLRADDMYWCAADPGWAYGLYYGVVGSLLTGSPSLLLEGGFSAATTMAILSDHKITNFTAAPTVYRAMRASDSPASDIRSLRCVSSAGEPLTPEVNSWARKALGVPVYDHYGQTETGMLINNHHHPTLQAPLKAGSMGRPMPGWKIVVLENLSEQEASPNVIGRVAIELAASPLAWFSEYIGDEERTAERFSVDGRYYLTGDVAARDEDGDFFFSARDDDVILMAGYRIGPSEIENVIMQHTAVAECGVTAVPDPIRGEVMEAFVVLHDGATGDADLEEEIRQWVKTRYAAHAYPRTVHFVESLPRTPSGKLQRGILKQRRLAELAAANH